MVTREKTLLKQDEVLGGFDPANYVTERLHGRRRATARRCRSRSSTARASPRDGSNPLLLYGYGSYGAVDRRRASAPTG